MEHSRRRDPNNNPTRAHNTRTSDARNMEGETDQEQASMRTSAGTRRNSFEEADTSDSDASSTGMMMDPLKSGDANEDDPLASMRRTLGLERRKSDMRQLGALLVILGIGACFSALALTAVLVEGMKGIDQIVGFRLPALVATLIQTIIGMVAMAVGFCVMLETPLSQRALRVARALVFVINLGPISFIITIVRLAQGAQNPPELNEFIPVSFGPTYSDVRFTVAMGILSLISVCGTLIGGLTIVGLNLCAYLGGKPVDKHRGYYVIRYAYYSILVFIGGLSQFLFGVFLWIRFGSGPYNEAVHVAVYTVFFPSITTFVGASQTVYGIMGWARAVGWMPIRSVNDQRFAWATVLVWIISMTLQFIFQPSYGGGMSFDAEGATYAAVYLGFFVMPLWLDWLVRVTPARIDPLYYGLPAETRMKEDFFCKVFKCTEGSCHLRTANTFHPTDTTKSRHRPSKGIGISVTESTSNAGGRERLTRKSVEKTDLSYV